MGDNLLNFADAQMVQSPKMAIGNQGIYEISSTQKLPLGARVDLMDGRSYVYCKAGAADLAPGKLAQAVAPTEEDQAVTVSAAVGDQFITVTFDGAAAANAWRGSILYVNDDTGEGQMFTVKDHLAGTTGVVVNVYEKVRTAITAGAGTISIVPNPYEGLIICPTTCTAMIIGVPNVTITAAYYGWVQVKGPCPVWGTGTLVVGGTVERSASVAGSVDPTTETTFGSALGQVMQVNATTEYSLVALAIPGF